MADYEISNVTLSHNRLVIGDTVSVGFTLKNTRGKNTKIERIGVALVAKSPDSTLYTLGVASIKVQEAVSISYNASKDFRYIAKIEDTAAYPHANLLKELHANPAVRALPVALRIVVGYVGESGMGGNQHPISDAYIMRSRCAPIIDKFELKRAINGAENDEGENLLSTLKLSMADTAEAGNMRLMLHYAQGNDATQENTAINLSPLVEHMLGGVVDDPALITRTFSNGHDWGFLLMFGDEYESVTASTDIARAFANLHLSGASTGGACFGGFSTSTEGNPKLESYFPGYFYRGINGLTNYSVGEVKVGGTYTDGKPIYRGVFIADVAANENVTITSGLDIETVISLEGLISYQSGGSVYHRPMNYYNSDSNNTRLYAQDGDIITNSTRAGTATVIAIYTKASYQPEYDQAALADANGSLIEDKDGNQVTVASETGNTVRLAHTAAEVDWSIERTDELYGAYISGELQTEIANKVMAELPRYAGEVEDV